MTFDDFDDDFDDPIDASYPQPAPVSSHLGDTEILLHRAIDLIATAPNMPLSSTPRIDRDELIEILEDSLARIPDEIRQARWMLKEREEFLQKTQREADEILIAARQQAERMVQRTEVVKAAETRARQVIDAADAETRRLRNETEDFLDQRLGSFEILLDRLSKTVAKGRQRLSIGDRQVPDVESRGDDAPPSTSRVEGKSFFDQDNF
jgi:F0F1-type ATP synthase membrane subunit b/b'